MRQPVILLIDSVINFLIGVLLLFYPSSAIELLGIPLVGNAFYPSILGAILVGIGIALFLEWRRTSSNFIGLGIGGAVVINICAALALLVWLVLGDLAIPLRGRLILWGLVLLIIGVVIPEIKNTRKSRITT